MPHSTEVDYDYRPNDDWTKWKEVNGWDFINGNEPWEHPAISPLGRSTRASYSDLDYPAISIVTQWIRDYWCNDILQRQDDLPEDLYYKSVEWSHAYGVKEKAHSGLLDDDIIYYHPVVELYIQLKRELDGKIFSDIPLGDHDISPQNSEYIRGLIRFEEEVLNPYLYDVETELLTLMVKYQYAPQREYVEDVLREEYKKRDERLYRVYFSDPSRSGNHSPIDYRVEYGNKVYHLMIILYPGNNLPSYIHDEMLFMNYLQNIVDSRYGEKWEKEEQFVQSRALLKDNVSLEDVAFGISSRGGFGT